MLIFSIISTAMNANSRLLRLPQEIKDHIYDLVLGRQLVHIHRSLEGDLSHHLCQATVSEKEAYEIFAASTEPWLVADICDRHNACYDVRAMYRDCPYCQDQLSPATESQTGLSLVLLRCCRQIYREARLIVFSANTLSFTSLPGALNFWISDAKAKFAIRRVHLDLMLHYDYEDMSWVFSAIAEDFKSLQHLSISIEQRPFEDSDLKQWQFEEPVESSSLRGLRKLRDLKLRTVTITVSDPHILHSGRKDFTAEDGRQYRWTMAQKQQWAEYMRRVLLRQEATRPAFGDRG